jgi:hypothetical protein
MVFSNAFVCAFEDKVDSTSAKEGARKPSIIYFL